MPQSKTGNYWQSTIYKNGARRGDEGLRWVGDGGEEGLMRER